MFTRKYAPPSSFPLSSAMRGMLRCPRRPAEHFTIVWRDKGHAEMSEACRVRGVRSALRPRCPKCVTSEVSEACRIRGVWGVPRSRCATSEVCHVRGVPRPRCATPEVCHVRGVPRPRCATPEVCHVRGVPRPRCATSEVCHVRGMPHPGCPRCVTSSVSEAWRVLGLPLMWARGRGAPRHTSDNSATPRTLHTSEPSATPPEGVTTHLDLAHTTHIRHLAHTTHIRRLGHPPRSHLGHLGHTSVRTHLGSSRAPLEKYDCQCH